MKTKNKLFNTILVILAFVGIIYGFAWEYRTIQQNNFLSQVGTPTRVAPAYLYPDPIKTPGKADTLKLSDLTQTYNGKTYSQSHRNVPESEKNQIRNSYPKVQCPTSSSCEIDHFYPLCAGGSNDIDNLWVQPEHNVWNGVDYGYRTKDKLEAYVCRQVKEGNLDPQIAFKRITEDWIDFYNSLYINVPTSTEPVE